MILHFVWQDSLVSFYYATHRVPNSPPTQPTHPKITALRTAAIVSLAVR